MNKKESLEHLFWRMTVKDDEDALKTIFFEFYPSLCVFAGHYVHCSETCRDIVQETFFRIWKNRKKIEINTSFRNFLVTCVRNACTDYLRKQNLSEDYQKKHTETILPASPEEVYTLNELQQMINNALQKLPENLRTAFEMNRFGDMTYTQVAQEMNVSVKTVESYISRALKILREELRDYLPFAVLFMW